MKKFPKPLAWALLILIIAIAILVLIVTISAIDDPIHYDRVILGMVLIGGMVYIQYKRKKEKANLLAFIDKTMNGGKKKVLKRKDLEKIKKKTKKTWFITQRGLIKILMNYKREKGIASDLDVSKFLVFDGKPEASDGDSFNVDEEVSSKLSNW